jgi:hypothetical protein
MVCLIDENVGARCQLLVGLAGFIVEQSTIILYASQLINLFKMPNPFTVGSIQELHPKAELRGWIYGLDFVKYALTLKSLPPVKNYSDHEKEMVSHKSEVLFIVIKRNEVLFMEIPIT